MSEHDFRDATGHKMGELAEINGNAYECIVEAMTVGPDEYETRLRWHRAKGRAARRFMDVRRATLESSARGKQ